MTERPRAAQPDATVVLNPDFRVGAVDRRLFGSFVEHLGRCVYTGIYEPGAPDAPTPTASAGTSPTWSASSAVTDRALPRRQLRLRLPLGGRRRAAERARPPGSTWRGTRIETNQVGIDEFMRWAARLGVEPMMAVNLGTRGRRGGPGPARVLQHRAAARAGPTCGAPTAARSRYGVRLWCLGNEMDGPWQIGHKTADEYGRLAAETGPGDAAGRPGHRARRVRAPAAGCRRSASGSATVLDRDLRRGRLRLAARLLRGARTTTAPASSASAVGHGPLHRDGRRDRRRRARRERGTTSGSHISFDEWNVWYQSRASSAAAGRLARRRAPAAPRGRLLGRRRRRRRQPAHLAAAPRRPGARRPAWPSSSTSSRRS